MIWYFYCFHCNIHFTSSLFFYLLNIILNDYCWFIALNFFLFYFICFKSWMIFFSSGKIHLFILVIFIKTKFRNYKLKLNNSLNLSHLFLLFMKFTDTSKINSSCGWILWIKGICHHLKFMCVKQNLTFCSRL